MRSVLCFSLLLLFAISMQAQRGAGAHFGGAPSFRAGGFVGFRGGTPNSNPNIRMANRFPSQPFFGNFNRNGVFFHGGFGFPHNGFGRHRFGFGNSPFISGWGWGGWGGWAWPYSADYSDWYYEQNQAQYEQAAEQDERLREQIQADQLRQMELDQQLAEQRAADRAARTVQTVPGSSSTAASTTSDRALPPTVLVYRDHHQVELRNYAIAGNTIYDFGPHWTRKIQISDLDLPATVQANDERGIEFRLPNSSPMKIKQQQVE